MVSKKPLSADRFKQICAEVAEHQGIAPDSELCAHIATLRLVREQQTASAIAGRHVNPEHLLKLDEALKQYLPPPKKPTLLTVKFVAGDPPKITMCPHCGTEFEAEHPENVLNNRPTLRRMLEAIAARDGHTAKLAPAPEPTATTPAPANQTPAPRTRADEEAEEEKKLALAAEKRRLARFSNGVDPGPPRPHVSTNIYGGDSPSSLMRRIERDYR
jgi:hypothetical protein